VCILSLRGAKTPDNLRPISPDKLDLVGQWQDILTRAEQQVPKYCGVIPLIGVRSNIRNCNRPNTSIQYKPNADTAISVLQYPVAKR
jgi:hypothetical protein